MSIGLDTAGILKSRKATEARPCAGLFVLAESPDRGPDLNLLFIRFCELL